MRKNHLSSYIYKVVVHLIPNPGLEIKYNRSSKRKVTSKQSTWTTLLP